MREEAEERRRMVEEQARKKKEEAERIRREKEAEKERIRQQKEAEAERIRQEKEAEKQRQFHERMLREAEDRRRGAIFRKELKRFAEKLEDQKEVRQKDIQKRTAVLEDFADAAKLLEEAQQRAKEQKQRERKRRQEERERALREKQLAELREQQEKQRREEEILQAQIARDRKILQPYNLELQSFLTALEQKKEARSAYQKKLEQDKMLFEQQRKEKIAARKASR